MSNADGEHGKAIEDRHRDGDVAEVPSPVAESDVRGHGSGRLPVPAVDQVEEGMGCRRLVVALLDLTEADVVDDEQLGALPRI